jgi:hypothetical protein
MENESNCKHLSFHYEEAKLQRNGIEFNIAIIRCTNCGTAIGTFIPNFFDFNELGRGIETVLKDIRAIKIALNIPEPNPTPPPEQL